MMLKSVDEIWGKVLALLMGIAAIYIALIMVAIVYASAFRFLDSIIANTPSPSSNMDLFLFYFLDPRGLYAIEVMSTSNFLLQHLMKIEEKFYLV